MPPAITKMRKSTPAGGLEMVTFKSNIRGAPGLKSAFEATSQAVERLPVYSYGKAIKFLRLYPRYSNEMMRLRASDAKYIIKYEPPIILGISKSMQWFVQVVLENQSVLEKFINSLANLDCRIELKEYDEAKLLLDSIRIDFGDSLILYSRELNIIFGSNSQEQARKDLDRRISELGNNIPSFVLRTSGRVYSNEFSYRAYSNNTNRTLKNVNPNSLRAFLKYWLLNDITSDEDIPQILSVSSGSSIFDLFFVLSDIIHQSNRRDRLINREKIENLISKYYEAFFAGLSTEVSSIENILDDAAYYGDSKDIDRVNNPSPSIRKSVGKHISEIFAQSYIRRYTPIGMANKINLIRNSRDFGETSQVFSNIVDNFSLYIKKTKIDLSRMEYLGSLTGEKVQDTEKSRHGKIINLFRNGDYVKSLDQLNLNLNLYVVENMLRFKIMVCIGDLDALISMTSELIISDPEYAYILPLDTIFSGPWKKFDKVLNKIDLAICMQALLMSSPSRSNLRNTRYAWQAGLRSLGYKRPSELTFEVISKVGNLPKIAYYLKYLCVMEVMETYREFERTRDIEIERRAIFANLIKIDPDNEEYYRQQILTITTKHKIDEAIKKMDRSRIFVDLGMMMAWSENILSDNLSQYKAIASRETEDAVSSFYDEVIRVSGDQQDSPLIVYVSSRESNHLLVNIIEEIKDNYLNNGDYGLDAYLSMRIRHGSFSGQIRSPLKINNIIANQNDRGDYSYDNAWISDFDTRSIPIINDIVKVFSKKFDDLIEEFIRRRLRIKSEDNPDGFFDIQLDNKEIKLLRDFAVSTDSAAALTLECSYIFKEKVNECLVKAKEYLINELQPSIFTLLNDIRNDVTRNIGHESTDAYIILHENATREITSALSRVADWFDFNSEYEKNSDLTFEDYVKLFLESARFAHLDFIPAIEYQIGGDFDLSDIMLYRLNDIIFTLIDNIYKYCGDTAPFIRLEFAVYNEKFMDITVVSSLSEYANRSESQKRTQDIVNAIKESSSLPQTRKEGRSGLIKVANMCRISGGDLLEAGVSDDWQFYKVSLRIGIK